MARKKKYVPKEKAVYTPSQVREVVKTQMDHYLRDVEFRVKQAYEVSHRGMAGVGAERGTIYAEDMVTFDHAITGYTVTSASPAAGQIAWTGLHIVYGGVDYAFTDGNAATTDYYLWFNKTLAPAPSGGVSTGNTLQKALITAKPTLATGDCVVFLNASGTAISVLESNIPNVVANNAIDTGALQNTAVTGAKIAATTITGGNLVNNTVTSTQIGTGVNGIASTNIQNGAVGNLAIGVGAVSATRLSILEHTIY